MSVTVRAKLIRWTVIILTVAAFAGSYRHTSEWAADHGPDGFWAYFTASIPEIMVIAAVLKAQDWSRDPAVWVTGISAVAFTLWANGASASPGASGMVVAIWPAYAALMALWLMGGHTKPEPEPTVTVTQLPARPAVQRKPRTVLADQDRPRRITANADDGQLARGVNYVRGLPDYGVPGFQLPSRAQLVHQTGISDSTAKRVRAAVRKELGQ